MISYRVGDATAPDVEGPIAIAHCCNDVGAWGGGFTAALDLRWPAAGKTFRRWAQTGRSDTGVLYRLGEIDVVDIGPDILVANMVGQHGIRGRDNPRPIDYRTLEECLNKLDQQVPADVQIVAPRLGAGLAGGNWERIETIISDVFTDRSFIVYDLPPGM